MFNFIVSKILGNLALDLISGIVGFLGFVHVVNDMRCANLVF